jgi:hypothetical protein
MMHFSIWVGITMGDIIFLLLFPNKGKNVIPISFISQTFTVILCYVITRYFYIEKGKPPIPPIEDGYVASNEALINLIKAVDPKIYVDSLTEAIREQGLLFSQRRFFDRITDKIAAKLLTLSEDQK